MTQGFKRGDNGSPAPTVPWQLSSFTVTLEYPEPGLNKIHRSQARDWIGALTLAFRVMLAEDGLDRDKTPNAIRIEKK